MRRRNLIDAHVNVLDWREDFAADHGKNCFVKACYYGCLSLSILSCEQIDQNFGLCLFDHLQRSQNVRKQLDSLDCFQKDKHVFVTQHINHRVENKCVVLIFDL